MGAAPTTRFSPRAPIADGRPLRVLIVEDNPADARLIVEMLRDPGRGAYLVETADRLDAALERLLTHAPDVVLLDLGLPGARGLEALNRVCAESEGIPTIILSGLRDEEVVARAAELGAQDYLVKGRFDGEVLARAIRYAIERQRASRALRESEERFRRLLDNAPDVIYRFRLAPTPSIDYVSPSILSATGYTPEEIYADPSLIPRSIHPEDRPRLARALQGDLTPIAPRVARWIHRDGRVVWLEHRTVTVRGRTGQPIAVEGIARDITARIEAEAETRLRTRALEAAVNAVVIADAAGNIQWVNPAFTALTGYTPQEVIGRNPRLLKSGKQDRAFYDRLWSTICSGKAWSGEVVNRRKDGGLYTEEMTITPVRSETGSLTHFVAIKQDVTARKNAEASRRETEERFREITDTIQEVFWITDPHTGRMIYISPAYERIWGRTCASLYEQPATFFEAIHPDDRERVIAKLHDHVRGQFDDVYRIVRPDGSLRWIQARAFPVRGPAGDILRMVGNAQDITEQREAEVQIQVQKLTLQAVVDNIPVAVSFLSPSGEILLVNREWERLLGWTFAEATAIDVVAECYPDPGVQQEVRDFLRVCDGTWKDLRTRRRDGRTIDTTWANVRLADGGILGVGQDMTERRLLESEYRQAQKMEAIGRLAGGVAHDFNNLLGVITGYSEIALRQLDEDHPARGRIAQVVKAAMHGAGLTRQLLAFSRRQVLEPKIVDLNDLLSELTKMLGRLIGEDIEMVFALSPESQTVRIDPGQMEQVVMNLVINARDAMPRGGTLTVETTHRVLDTPLLTNHGSVPPGAYAVLDISDTGEGITPANLGHIFEPFFTTKPLGEGTGLGLSTAYGIVKQSGGYIDVSSEVGRGTTFRIYLPRVLDDTTGSATPIDETTPLTGDETILLVEDKESLREVIAETLQSSGYRVLAADGADAALEIAQHEGTIHLLLTDVVMPKISGPQLAAQLARVRPDTRVLFMSGYTDDVLGHHGARATGFALLEKPFTSDELAKKVRSVLDQKGS